MKGAGAADCRSPDQGGNSDTAGDWARSAGCCPEEVTLWSPGSSAALSPPVRGRLPALVGATGGRSCTRTSLWSHRMIAFVQRLHAGLAIALPRGLRADPLLAAARPGPASPCSAASDRRRGCSSTSPPRGAGPVGRWPRSSAEIAAAGWVVRHVDVDRETDLVRRFGVTGVPCYVLLVKGHEVGRINGATTQAELERLLGQERAAARGSRDRATGGSRGRRGRHPAAGRRPPCHSSPNRPVASRRRRLRSPAGGTDRRSRARGRAERQPSSPPPPSASAATRRRSGRREPSKRKLLAATARLRVEDSSGVSWGTGTVIDCRQGEALILTCGHIFRDSDGKGRVEVDLFGPQRPARRRRSGGLLGPEAGPGAREHLHRRADRGGSRRSPPSGRPSRVSRW